MKTNKIYKKCPICEKHFLKTHIHHINGIHEDDREENRIEICINCHRLIHVGLSKNKELIYHNDFELFKKINEYRKKINSSFNLLPNYYLKYAL